VNSILTPWASCTTSNLPAAIERCRRQAQASRPNVPRARRLAKGAAASPNELAAARSVSHDTGASPSHSPWCAGSPQGTPAHAAG
jgi:hypothetical protein